MKKEWILIPVTCFSMVFCGWAEAQGVQRIGSPGKTSRIDLNHRSSPSINRATRSTSVGRAAVSNRRPASRGTVDRPFGRNGSHAPVAFGGSDFSGNPLGSLLGQYLNGGYGHGFGFDPYEGQKAQAKAYRDAAIANAIVNVVGILATANQPAVQAVCPAPPAPRGHVERQRILVQEGRTEEYQVWIPEYVIPETGEVVVGHHETRRREIAPVYEEREVWIPAL